MSKRPRLIVLTVLDGWGYRAETKGNAIALARKPRYDELIKKFPNTLIHTSGPFVGLRSEEHTSELQSRQYLV